MLKIVRFLSLFLLIVSCNKSDDDDNSTFTFDKSQNSFVWKAMNSWYNWQESVPNLADEKENNTTEFESFLNSFDTPQDLFESLKHSEDDFSWFIEDYVAQQESFQGITTTFGFRPALVRVDNTDFIIIYIQHVSKGSPADLAGFKRGDIINAINGTVMTLDNYDSVFDGFFNNTASFTFTEKDGITIKESKTITQTVVSDNPIHLTKIFENIGGKKVGYLVYNGFRSSFNDELNAAFAEFKTAGVQELILDLRINGGGSVLTSAFLASMIYDQANENTTFGELKYNSKHQDSNTTVPFFNELFIFDDEGNYTEVNETINRLSGITKLYVLASRNTASASEMIINGLRPFIEVKIVGTTTTGKNEGSITLYDSPSSDYTDVDTANPAHVMAMQPIVFQIFNSLGQSDYNFGFEPDIFIAESWFWDTILPFGDENEVVLKTALDDIRGLSAKSINPTNPAEEINITISKDKFQKEMYLDSNFFN